MQSDNDKLERLIDGVLREQPLLQAPSGMQSRVLAAIEAGRAVAGWKQGFVHWPLLARVAFILASIGFVKLASLAVGWTLTTLHPSSYVEGAVSKVTWIKVLAELIYEGLRSMPEHWLWTVFAVVALVYAGFFTISAIAYRALYASR